MCGKIKNKGKLYEHLRYGIRIIKKRGASDEYCKLGIIYVNVAVEN